MHEVAERLFEAHVAHALARFRGEALRQTIEPHVDALFAWLAEVPLETVVPRQRVIEVIDRLVIELRVSGGITELAGEMARVVVSSQANHSARLEDILSSDSFRDFSDKLIAFDPLRRELIALFVRSSALSDAGARLLSQRLSHFLARTLGNPGSPLPQDLRAKLRASALPSLERRLGAWLFRHFEQNRERFAQDLESRLTDVVDEPFLRALLDDVWEAISSLPLSHWIDNMGEQDLEDAVVFVFEFWLRFRKTDYFRQVSRASVVHFFSKYGSESVAAVIDDMGVTREMVSQELVIHLTPWAVHGLRTGFLEHRIREELRAFYGSPACAEALAGSSR